MASKDGATACPSSKCEPGASLLGIVQEDGTVGYLGDPLPIDSEFVDRAHRGRTPERRFRFASPCVEGACRQWTGTRCGVIDNVLKQLGEGEAGALPHCGIRAQCRWFRQSGADACAACSLVVTDTRDLAPSAQPA